MNGSQPKTTAVVTGAAGFIGSHLTAALLGSHRSVIGIDNFDPFYDPALKRNNLPADPTTGFDLVEADIRDRAAMLGLMQRVRPTVVFHMAALAGVRPSIENPAAYASVNIDGLVNVLDAARACQCHTVVFASSSSVYGNASSAPFSERDPALEPISPYAATKRSGELICWTYAHLFGMRIAALRFFTVYGPAQRPDLAIAKFMHLLAAGREIPMFGDGTMSRDYTYIDDIIDGVLAAERAIDREEFSVSGSGDSGLPGGFRIWNLGSAHPIRLDEMIDRIGQVVGARPRIKRMPAQPGDVQRTFADLTRSRAELGYEPRTDFEQGLHRQWEWTKAQLQSAVVQQHPCP